MTRAVTRLAARRIAAYCFGILCVIVVLSMGSTATAQVPAGKLDAGVERKATGTHTRCLVINRSAIDGFL